MFAAFLPDRRSLTCGMYTGGLDSTRSVEFGTRERAREREIMRKRERSVLKVPWARLNCCSSYLIKDLIIII